MKSLRLPGSDEELPLRGRLQGARNLKNTTTRLSIVLPTHQEGERLGRLLDRLASYLARQPWRAEVIVVDDGSGDDTADIAAMRQGRLKQLTVLKHGARRGKGAAARSGVLVARGDFVVVSDVGLSCPLSNLNSLIERLDLGADVCVVSRRIPGSSAPFDEPLIAKLTDTAFRALANLVVPVKVQDIQGGFKGFRRLAAQKIAMRARIDGPTYDVEWLKLGETFGFDVVEIPARMAEYRPGEVEVRGASASLLRDLLRIRRNLGSAEYDRPRGEGSTLFDTSFVKLDRESLVRDLG